MNLSIHKSAKKLRLEFNFTQFYFKVSEGFNLFRFFLVMALSLYSLCNAQETKEEADSTITFESMVFSPTRFEKSATYTPSNIALISKEDNVFNNPQTAADLLGSSGNVFIQKSQQGGGSPMIRGFATNRLLYSVDGVRMNNAIFRGGNIQNVISLDPFAIERTEVFLGAGSVFYGSDAIGGVMSFKTLSPKVSKSEKTEFSGNLVGRTSSANQEKTIHTDFNIGFKKWAFLTSFSYVDYDDLKAGTHGPQDYLRNSSVERINNMDVEVENSNNKIQNPSAYTQFNLMQKVRYEHSNKLKFEYGFHYSETSEYARYDRHLRRLNGNPRYGQWDYGPQKWMMNHISIDHLNHNFLYDRLNIDAAYQRFEESRITRNLNSENQTTRTEKVDAYSLNIDFLKKINRKNQLQFGLEEVFNNVDSEGVARNISTKIEEQSSSRYPNSIWNSFGFYLFNHYKANQKLSFDYGFRYNYYYLNADFNTQFFNFPFQSATLHDSSLSGEVGFVYRGDKDWTFKSKISSAFRTPNVDDVGKIFDSEPGSVVVPNPNLDEEQSYNIEGTVKKKIKNFNFSVSAFYTYLDNALVRRNFTFNGVDSIEYEGELSQVQAIQNASRAKVYGFQANIDWNFLKYLNFDSQFNFQKGEEELDDGSTSPARHAAPFFSSSKLRYSKNKLMLELGFNYSNEVLYEDLPVEERNKTEIYALDSNGNPWSPSWYTLNLKGRYNISKNTTLTGGIENITDQLYRPYSSGIAAAGRNFTLAVKVGF